MLENGSKKYFCKLSGVCGTLKPVVIHNRRLKKLIFQTCFAGVTCSGDSDHKADNQENGTNNRVDAISKLTTVKGNNDS